VIMMSSMCSRWVLLNSVRTSSINMI